MSVLTEVCVIRKVKKSKLQYINYADFVRAQQKTISAMHILRRRMQMYADLYGDYWRTTRKPVAASHASAISSLLFVSTHRKPPQLLPVFAPSNVIYNRNFLVFSLHSLFALVTNFHAYDRCSDIQSIAACNISIPSPAVVSARRGHHHPLPEPITNMYTVVNLVDPDPTSPVTAATVLVQRTSLYLMQP